MKAAYQPTAFTTRPELVGSYGMVAATHWLGAAAAMAVLEEGGNAFDAAAAGGFVLQVVEPDLNGPGGDMSLMFGSPRDPLPTVLSGQGPAPQAADPSVFEARGFELIPGSGPLAAVVPGATPAWLTLLRDHGRMPLRSILQYAIHYARTGHPTSQRMHRILGEVGDQLRQHWPSSAQVFLDRGHAPGIGIPFRNPKLAETYEGLVREAEAGGGSRTAQFEAALRAWNQGFVAEAVDRFFRGPLVELDGSESSGLLTGEDMARYSPAYEEPTSLGFRGWTVHKTAAWGQGPVLLQQLALLEGYPDIPYGSAEMIHLVVECAKLAFADREAYYGDTLDVPLGDLLSANYSAERRTLIGPLAAPALRPGSPGGRIPRLPDLVRRRSSSEGWTAEYREAAGPHQGDTCQIDVVDQDGVFVAATPSGGWLQSSPVIEELGFALGTRLQMFWLEQGLPNSLAPGKRPRTTLTPTLITRDGIPVLALGTPGGDWQDQWQLAFLLAHLTAAMGLQQAADAPTWHTNAFPSSFYPRDQSTEVVVEARVPPAAIRALRARGHDVKVAPPWSLGQVCAVGRDPNIGILTAVASPRRMQAYACGR